MQTRYWDFSEIDSTEYMNEVIRSMLVNMDIGPSGSSQARSGRLTGFIATANGTPDDSVDLNRGGFSIQSVITNDGVIVIEDTDLDDPVSFDNVESNPRIDLVAIKHEYRAALPVTAATYVVVKGTAAAEPVPPYSSLGADETPLAEVWIDTAPGTGNPPVIQSSHIRVPPTCLGALVANHEYTWGKTNNYDGNSAAWASMGSNDDRFYILRDPDDDNQVFFVLNAYYNPPDGKWYQEDAARGSVLALYNDSTGTVTVWGVYHAEAGTTAAAFASFWTELATLDTDGILDFTNDISDVLTGVINLEDIHDEITSTTDYNCAAAVTGTNRLGVFYTHYSSGLYFIYSDDDGYSYGSSQFIATKYDTAIPADHMGMEAIGTQTLVAVYYDKDSVGSQYGIYARRSTNNGATWGSPITIIDENEAGVTTVQKYGADVSLLADGTTLMCAFTFYDGSNYRVALKKSTDNGATWGTRIDAYTTSSVVDDPRIAVFPTGRIVMLYANPTSSNISLLYSDNGGSSWGGPITVDATGGDRINHTIFYDPIGDKLFAFHSETSTSDRWIKYQTSLDAGLTWTAQKYLWQHPDNEPDNMTFVLTKLGQLVLVYHVSTGNDVEQVRGNLMAVAAKV